MVITEQIQHFEAPLQSLTTLDTQNHQHIQGLQTPLKPVNNNINRYVHYFSMQVEHRAYQCSKDTELSNSISTCG